MTTKTTLTALLALSCLFASSCRIGPEEPSALGSRQFSDAVVPDGFTIRDSESHSNEIDTYRFGHFVYNGDSYVEEASAYVRGQMPRHSWKLVGQEPVDDDGMRLRFERGIYSADYEFSRRDGTTRMVVKYTTDYTR